jgi:hypothetical protein
MLFVSCCGSGVFNNVLTGFEQKRWLIGCRTGWNRREWSVRFWNKFLLLQLKNLAERKND